MEAKQVLLLGGAGLVALMVLRNQAGNPASIPAGPNGAGSGGSGMPPTGAGYQPNYPGSFAGSGNGQPQGNQNPQAPEAPAEGTTEWYQAKYRTEPNKVIFDALNSTLDPVKRTAAQAALRNLNVLFNWDQWSYYRSMVLPPIQAAEMEVIISGRDRNTPITVDEFVGRLPAAGLSGLGSFYGSWG